MIIPTNSKNDNLNVINSQTLEIKQKKPNKKFSVDLLKKIETTKLYSIGYYKMRLFKLYSEFTPVQSFMINIYVTIYKSTTTCILFRCLIYQKII